MKKEVVEPKKQNEIEEPMTKVPISLNTSSPDVSSSSDLNISEKERKRREKELRRLQENIVKNDTPLPSRRVIKRNSRYLDSSNENTVEFEEVAPSPAVRRRSDGEKSVEKKSLPTKLAKSITETPSSLPVRSARTTVDSRPKASTEFTTSTPKISKSASSVITPIEKVLPIKRKSNVPIENLSAELKVPPLKISTLAKKATVEIKRITPVRNVEIPTTEKVSSVRKSPSKTQLDYEAKSIAEPFKFKKIVLKSMSGDKLSNKLEDKIDLKHEEEEVMDVDCSQEGSKIQEKKLNRKDIENMGYVAVRSGFIFQCLAEKKFSFINHLEENHVGVNWSGHCKLCSSKVDAKDKSKEGEFWHMMEHVHEEKTNPDELPDIIEIPKEIEKPPETVSEDMTDLTANVQSDDDNVISEDSHSGKNVFSSQVVKVKSFIDEKPSFDGGKKDNEKPLETEVPKRITVKSFANFSKFSPQQAPQTTAKPVKLMIQPKPCDVPKKNIESEKLLVRPRIIEISKKDIKSDTAGKSQINNLKALMEKQTEENFRKLQSAAKSAQLISSNESRQKDQSLENQILIKKIPIQQSMQQKQPIEKSQRDQTPEGVKMIKFFIRKPTSSNNGEIQVEDNKLPKDSCVNLRPWLNKPVKKYLNKTVKLLETPALIATFKCMGLKCEFFTDSKEEFEKHLHNHLIATPGDIASYIVCPYCDFDFTKYSITDLTQHITDEHAYEKYQCKFCFYRGCSNFYVVEHQKIHHRMQQHSVIKLENSKHRDYNKEKEKVKQTCGKFIKPLLCASKSLNFPKKKLYQFILF